MRRLLPITAVLLYLFLHLPLLVLGVFSFNSSRFTVWESLSLRWYRAALQDSQLIEATINSLLIALVATAAATVIGTLCDVIKNSAQDLYEVERENKGKFLIPAVEEFILKIDMESRTMTVRLIEGLIE